VKKNSVKQLSSVKKSVDPLQAVTMAMIKMAGFHSKPGSLFKVLIFVAILTTATCLRRHKRQCCKYSFDDGSGSRLCENSSACLFESADTAHNVTSAPLDVCRVLGDSKRDIATVESRQACLDQNFGQQEDAAHGLAGWFELRRYIMESDLPQNEFQSVEVVLPSWHDWFSAKFRIFNIVLCPKEEMSEWCAPRCVDMEWRSTKMGSRSIVYDCEGGFYVSDSNTKLVRSTAEDSYQVWTL
jgi:hypothetical protein